MNESSTTTIAVFLLLIQKFIPDLIVYITWDYTIKFHTILLLRNGIYVFYENDSKSQSLS